MQTIAWVLIIAGVMFAISIFMLVMSRRRGSRGQPVRRGDQPTPTREGSSDPPSDRPAG